MALTLAAAQGMVQAALAHARTAGFRPLSVVVLDARGAVIAAASEDGTSLKRFQIAKAKADGALAFGLGSRALERMAAARPTFYAGAAHVVDGLIPVAGAVLVRDVAGALIGVVGVSGDTSDNDEAAAIAGVTAAGLVADGG
ncbi:heme-binding protein [Tabrizicola sp. J26]|uniref:GlcG/HbpS family heme-binding protein n=1 Tax=Alitabrizicola rongguiensis TaxID=2909234 RepID=UPI001F31BCBF|nr:heme-binding protein [Tabrizicola rongguiensis]MCF1707759.1 heme-binding protein [Tabrizicola rongguiensis]